MTSKGYIRTTVFVGAIAILAWLSVSKWAERASSTKIDAIKADTTKIAVPDSVVLAAKAAFEKNKCGACHSVGEFAAAKPPAKKMRDLSGVGLTRTAVWISAFLQKKEKIGDKLHMKAFAGTEAELASLSQWLASERTKTK